MTASVTPRNWVRGGGTKALLPLLLLSITHCFLKNALPRELPKNRSFLLDYCNRGCLPEVKHMIIDMSLNASGVRDTARSLHICPNTVLRALKKKATALESVNTS